MVAEVRLYGNQHFVLVTGYTTEGGLQIDDPWFGDSVRFRDRYGDPASGILSIRTFTPVDSRPVVERDWVTRTSTAVSGADR